MASGKTYKAILLIMAVAFLFSVSFIQHRLNGQRENLGLTRIEPLENAPPVLAFTTVALGSFRGLIANALWVRLSDLQEKDKYFEMVQLADWITKLQPHFAAVWVHLAWNMSYNISVKFNNPEERWPWVLRGIELMRDQGLYYNPTDPLMYRELAWHFQHKMGANLDDAHNYYKAVWIEEMTQVFGEGRPNLDELINPQTDDAKKRSELLREKYKMNPVWVKEVDDEYGPLEWRLPEAHAIYWAKIGLDKLGKDKLKKDDLTQLRRVIFQSMQLAFQRGRLVFPKKGQNEFIYVPNIEIIAKANKAYEQMIADEPNQKDHLGVGHKNFLRMAVFFLYTYNRVQAAEEWFNYLKSKYPGSVPEGQDVHDYTIAKVEEELGETSHDRTKALLEGFFTTAFIQLAIGEDDSAASYDRMAARVYSNFQSRIGKSIDRVGLPPLAELKRGVLERLLPRMDPDIAAQLRARLNLPPDAYSTPVNPEPAAQTPQSATQAAGR